MTDILNFYFVKVIFVFYCSITSYHKFFNVYLLSHSCIRHAELSIVWLSSISYHKIEIKIWIRFSSHQRCWRIIHLQDHSCWGHNSFSSWFSGLGLRFSWWFHSSILSIATNIKLFVYKQQLCSLYSHHLLEKTHF